MNLKLNSSITNEEDILNEADVYQALQFDGGIKRSNVIIFDGANLKGHVLQNGKEFKASKTDKRVTHEVIYMSETLHNIWCHTSRSGDAVKDQWLQIKKVKSNDYQKTCILKKWIFCF